MVRRIRRMGDQRPHALNGIPNRNPLKMQALPRFQPRISVGPTETDLSDRRPFAPQHRVKQQGADVR